VAIMGRTCVWTRFVMSSRKRSTFFLPLSFSWRDLGVGKSSLSAGSILLDIIAVLVLPEALGAISRLDTLPRRQDSSNTTNGASWGSWGFSASVIRTSFSLRMYSIGS